MKLSKISKLFQSMYSDTMDIYRLTTTKNTDGTTGKAKSAQPIHKDIACRLSFQNSDNAETQKDDFNPIYKIIKIFCNSDTDILKGDTIIINKLDDSGNIMCTYKGTANLPSVYTTHKEIELVQVGDA